MQSTAPDQPVRSYARRVLIAVAITVAVVVGVLLIWYVARMLLVLFAGLLFAIFLRGVSDWISERTGIPEKWSLTLVCLVLLALAIATLSTLAAQIAQQVDELTEGITRSVQQLQDYLDQYAWGRELIEQAPQPSDVVTGKSDAVPSVMGVFSTVVGGLTGTVLILFVGLYIAAEPNLYRSGLLKLVPIRRRPRAGEVLHRVHMALKGWLFAQLISMSIIGVMTMIGLAVIGIPLWFILGILTAALTFIPNIGPVLSVVPPVLLALNEEPIKALYVVGFYLALQTVESYFITPLIQQRAISLPPVVILSAQVLMGVMLGAIGLALATPLVAALMVLVEMLYVQSVLGDRDIQITGPESNSS